MHSSTRVRRWATVAAVALSATALGTATAAAASPALIAPHQLFLGQVNGASAHAVIKVGCFGPVTPGQTGHPVSGQSVDVVPALGLPTEVAPGYTGASADRVLVQFGAPASFGTATVLRAYGVKAEIPTGMELPCYGTGKVAFVPLPTSRTARTGYVTVTYESIGV
jgi:hypothetical protein